MTSKRKATDDLPGPASKRTNYSIDPRTKISRDPDDYTIGIVCAIPIEADAVHASLDVKLQSRDALDKAERDNNTYTFGKIGRYHVVVVHLADMGPVEAAQAAESMSRSFNRIQLCLVVGVCGIIPKITREGREKETLLGDVVLSTKLLQYTLGRRYPNGFEMKETLGRPDRKLRSLFNQLSTIDGLQELRNSMQQHLTTMLARENMAEFVHPGHEYDHLYEASYIHEHKHADCSQCAQKELCKAAATAKCSELGCDQAKLVTRRRLSKIQDIHDKTNRINSSARRKLEADLVALKVPEIFLETIGSGDQVLKSGSDRDEVASEQNIAAFEMEGAGIWDIFPTVVIKGGCDYADSHKNKKYQKYAAAAAASCAKSFIEMSQLPIPNVTVLSHSDDNVVIGPPQGSITEPTKEQICAWLTDLDFELVQRDCLNTRLPGTASWFVETKAVQDWLTNESGVLCCSGIRGSGKTILMSQTIDYLRNTTSTGDIVLFQYLSSDCCNDTRTHLAAFLRQIVCQVPDLSDAIKELYRRHYATDEGLSKQQLLSAIMNELSKLTNVYIVVDALDETTDDVRFDLIKILMEMKRDLTSLRLLFSSWDAEMLEMEIPEAHYYEIKARESDLKLFIANQLNDKMHIRRLIWRKPNVIHDITTKLVEKAGGMFLLAYLHLEKLGAVKRRSVIELMEAVNDLSSTLMEVYTEIWSQVLSQDSEDQTIAREVFRWLIFSKQSVPVFIIRHARFLSGCSTEEEMMAMTDDHLIEDLMIVAPCKGLVRIERSRNIISFVHHTAHEFFRAYPEMVGDLDEHYNIALTCLKHLHQQFLMKDELPSRSPLIQYALHHLGFHAGLAPEERLHLTIMTCLDDFRVRDEIGSLYLEELYYKPHDETASRHQNISPLHLASIMGLNYTSSILLADEADINCNDSFCWTPLRWAAAGRNIVTIQLLIEKGADLSHKASDHCSTLQWAFGRPGIRHWTFIDHIITGDARSSMGSRFFGLTPQMSNLWMQAPPIRTSPEILEELIRSYPHTEIVERGTDLMLRAATKRLGFAVEALLHRGVALDSTALEFALLGPCSYLTLADSTFTGNSQNMMGIYASIDARDWHNVLDITWSVEDDPSWICSLIDQDMVNVPGIRGRTPLSVAAEMGFVSVCERLIECGAEIDAADMDGWTPLMWAVIQPRPQKIIVENCVFDGDASVFLGAMFDIYGEFPEHCPISNPSSDARAASKVNVVRLLLEKGANSRARDHHRISVLDKAQWDNIPGVIETLISYDPEISSKRQPLDALGPLIVFSQSVMSGDSKVFYQGNVTGDLSLDGNAHLHFAGIPSLPSHVVRKLISLIHISISGVVITGNAKVLAGISRSNPSQSNSDETALMADFFGRGFDIPFGREFWY